MSAIVTLRRTSVRSVGNTPTLPIPSSVGIAFGVKTCPTKGKQPEPGLMTLDVGVLALVISPIGVLLMPMDDPRYLRLKQGLLQLTNQELQKVLDHPEPMVYDGFNFDETTGRF